MPTTPHLMLITGGSRGIGAATAWLAAERGHAVAINYARDADAANRLVQRIRQAGGQAQAFQADVSQEAEVLRMFARIDERMGRITALVNNAGVVDLKSRVDEMSAKRLERMFAVNITGAFLCAREAVKRMSTLHGARFGPADGGGRGGAIVNVSSAAARIGSPGMYVDYAASKAAIDTLTLGLAKEVAAEGIRVNAVRPGVIDTEIHAASGDAGRAQAMAPQLPMQRPGRADEVAQAILWLLSDEASYVTGSLLDVAGGR